MPTLLTARAARGDSVAAVELSSTADTATLAATLSTDGVLVAFDVAKVPDRRTLVELLARIKARLHAVAFPHA